jgi:threonine dehydratase
MSTPQRITIEEAHTRIAPYTHRTPLVTNQTISELVGAQVFLKCENLQKTGAFKGRGAMNAVLSLSDTKKVKGVATHSSGNHGQALAWAAKQMGISAYIVMPSNSPEVKKAAVIGYGAEVVTCEPNLEARESTLEKVIARTGAHVIHPYNDYRVIAGQATCAKEMLEQQPDLDAIFCPVGGGGLLSGTALSAHYFGNVPVYGCEPEMADDAKRSFEAGYIIPSVNPNTIADGLKTSLGDKTFPIIRELVTDIFTVSEAEIIAAMRLIWERTKLVVEPSGAVGLAVLLRYKSKLPPIGEAGRSRKKVGVILCGGNIDLANLKYFNND